MLLLDTRISAKEITVKISFYSSKCAANLIGKEGVKSEINGEPNAHEHHFSNMSYARSSHLDGLVNLYLVL